MRARRFAPSRRRDRPVRVVSASAARPPLADEEIGAWRVGLEGARLLAVHFEDSFRAHAAALRLTPTQLLGCCAAFWQLVKQAGLPLREIGSAYDGWGEMELDDTPEETLVSFDGVSPGYLADLGYNLWCPRPCYYGWGVQALLDEGQGQPDALTALLWHLFAKTSLGLGVDLAEVTKDLDEAVLIEIARITPLPSGAPIHTLAAHLDLELARAIAESKDDLVRATGQLIEYAFGKTGNPLADNSDYEVDAILMGEIDEGWSWDELPQMITLSRQARALETAYGQWGRRIDRDPAANVRALGIAIHKAARAAERALQGEAGTLLTLLGKDVALQTMEGALRDDRD